MPSSIQFNTAHNVNINVSLATLPQRIVAYLLDSFIKAGYGILIGYLAYSFVNDIRTILPIIFILIIPILFYSLFFEVMYNGQTPGKQVMNIKVVNLNGNAVTFGQYLTRWLFRMIDISSLSGLIAILSIAIGSKGQRIGDMVAGTTVIDTARKPLSNIDKFESLNPNYVPKYTDAKQLTASEINLIKEVLANESENRFELIIDLSDKIQEQLYIEKEDSSEAFLRILIKDNQYYKTNYLDAPTNETRL